MKKTAVGYLKSILWIVLASVIYAIGFDWCLIPTQIVSGGLTGVAQIVNSLAPALPVGTLVVLMNIPLFLLGWRLLGWRTLVTTLLAMAASSLLLDGIGAIYAFPSMDPLLAAIFGGALVGLALGMVFQQGATTGGTDLIARLLKLKLAWLPMGKLLLIIDLLVILASAAVFRNIYSALYGMIALFISSKVIDGVLYGMDTARVAYIISDRPEEITHSIIHNIDRGVTILKGRGGYSGAEKQVLLVAFKQRQIVAIKRLVKELDPAAFLIVCEAHEVLGDGFREYQQNDL